ncbi:MAG: AmmeMemoRadiSam system radical SAM enzyme [Campylobacterales bacterium]
MREQWSVPKGDKIICNLCRHHCTLAEGQVGMCGVEANHEGHLTSLVYGYPASINIDPIEKKPLNHLLPGSTSLSLGTVGCNFRCPFCQNWQISQNHRVDTHRYVSPEEIVTLAIAHGCASISYTYNEPTVFYPYAYDIGQIAKKKGLKNIFVTNGFQTPELIHEMASWVDAANIDLKSFNDTYYKKTLKGGLEAIKENIALYHQLGIWIEVTTLIIPGINDTKDELQAMASFLAGIDLNIPWHLSAFHPDYQMLSTPPTSLASLKQAEALGKAVGLRYIYIGNVWHEHARTHCPNCGAIVIEREGYRIITNRLDHGQCYACGEVIAGVWY